MDAQIRRREFRNLKTAWLDVGPSEAPILLFLHGYPDSADTWSFQVDHFKSKYHVVCPFSRGTGGTEGSEASDSVERYSQNALALDTLQILESIDPTQKRPIVIVGHDLGVVTAWNLAPLLKERLRGLILMNGLNLHQMLMRAGDPTQLLKSWYIYLINIPYLSEFVATHFSKKVLKLAYDMGGLPSNLREVPEDPSRNLIAPMNQYRAFAREIPKTLRHKPLKIKCPTLVIWGKNDAFLVPPTLDELEPYTNEVTVRILDANHWVHRERNDEVNSLVETFLEGISLDARA